MLRDATSLSLWCLDCKFRKVIFINAKEYGPMIIQSGFSFDFAQIRWEILGANRVVLWEASRQPPSSELERLSSKETLSRSNKIKHDGRRREWLASRALSRALTGYEPAESSVGVPLWPEGWFGSISHKAGHVALWTSRWDQLTCGVDLEESKEFEFGLSKKIMNEREIMISEKSIKQDSASLIFSSKEAIYKALCPLVGRLFYFESAELIEVTGDRNYYQLTFLITENLSAMVPRGVRVQVYGKRLKLDDKTYWLAFALFPRFGDFMVRSVVL